MEIEGTFVGGIIFILSVIEELTKEVLTEKDVRTQIVELKKKRIKVFSAKRVIAEIADRVLLKVNNIEQAEIKKLSIKRSRQDRKVAIKVGEMMKHYNFSAYSARRIRHVTIQIVTVELKKMLCD